MILVLILLTILIFILLLALLIVVSTLKIEVKNLCISNIEKKFNEKQSSKESIKQQDLRSLLKEQDNNFFIHGKTKLVKN